MPLGRRGRKTRSDPVGVVEFAAFALVGRGGANGSTSCDSYGATVGPVAADEPGALVRDRRGVANGSTSCDSYGATVGPVAAAADVVA